MSSPCMSGFRPYTCMSCIQFTNEEHAFADSLCDSSSLLLQTEDVQNDILRRYMEVYKNPLYWTGYELKNRRATVPKSNITLEMSVSESCSGNNCCVAWQFKPFGPIALDCDQMLPAICIMAVKCEFIQIILHVQYVFMDKTCVWGVRIPNYVSVLCTMSYIHTAVSCTVRP